MTEGRTDGRYQVHYLPASRSIMISVLGVRTAAALIRMQCSFRGPCNALNMHSSSVWDVWLISHMWSMNF